jgi:hypothetical protein
VPKLVDRLVYGQRARTAELVLAEAAAASTSQEVPRLERR